MFPANDLLPRDQTAAPAWLRDPSAPWVRPAGVPTSRHDEAIKAVFAWDAPQQQRPETPPEMKRYRQSTLHEPGMPTRDWRRPDRDSLPQGPAGVRRAAPQKGGDVWSCITVYPSNEVSQWALEQAEGTYASSKREPLGRPYVRGYKMPEGLGTTRAFGKPVDALRKVKEGQAGHVIFPTDQSNDQLEDDIAAHVRSHAAYAPGEQRRRGYAWEAAGVDIQKHRFGAVRKGDDQGGVKQALHPSVEDQGPVVGSRIQEEHVLAAHDHLGRPRKLGQGDRWELPRDHAYGKPTARRTGEPSMAELLQGSYTESEQQPDADLGRCLHEGWRNVAPPQRVFGVPSVRSDVHAPQRQSVADATNYGNEPDAFQLIRPTRSAERGITEQHYLRLRSKPEVQVLARDAGIQMSAPEFDHVFEAAAAADDERDFCCLDTFFRARHQLLAHEYGLNGIRS